MKLAQVLNNYHGVELARLLNVHPSTITHWRVGRRSPSKEHCLMLIKKLHLEELRLNNLTIKNKEYE